MSLDSDNKNNSLLPRLLKCKGKQNGLQSFCLCQREQNYVENYTSSFA